MCELDKLCHIDAVSGDEGKLSDYLCKLVDEPGCNSRIDDFGNVIVNINNNSDTTVMLDAHIDQIGLVVKDIDNDGFISFIAAGGVDTSILPAAEVIVHGKKDLFGVITTPPLSMTGNGNDAKIENFSIDCGLSSEKIKDIVNVGDTISFVGNYIQLKNDYISSKSLDNRIGVFVVAECLKRLKSKKIPYNIVGLFSAGEENGCTPAGLAAEQIKPDYAIVVDVTFGLSPTTNDEDSFKMGEGITVAVGPSLDRNLSDNFISFCEKNKISYCKEICNRNPGTNSWSIQVAGNGVKCLLVSVPIKYMHSTVETVSVKDIHTAIEAICLFLEGGVLDA